MPEWVNGVRYVRGNDPYAIASDSWEHARSDAQQALDAANDALLGAKAYTDIEIANATLAEGTIDVTDSAVGGLIGTAGTSSRTQVDGRVNSIAVTKAGHDAATAQLIGTSGSATRTGVDDAVDARTRTGARPVGQGELGINVLDHGVKGDGVTDDTAALKTLLASAETFNADIFMPAGVYRVSGSGSPLQAYGKNRVIRGSGRGTIIRADAGGDGTVMAVAGGVTVADLTIDGGFNPATATANLFSVLNLGDDSTVERCYIYNARGSCVTISGQRVGVHGNTLEKFGDHAIYGAQDIGATVPYTVGLTCRDVSITGNIITDDPTYHNAPGDPVRGAIKFRNNVENVTITGNVIIGDQCVILQGDNRRTEACPRGISIGGNVLIASHSGVALYTSLYAGLADTGIRMSKVLISGNYVGSRTGTGDLGVRLIRSRATVVGNAIYSAGTAVGNGSADDLGAVDVRNNHIEVGGSAITQLGTGSSITDNTIVGGGTRGIWVAFQNYVRGNKVSGVAGDGIWVGHVPTGADMSVIVGNDLLGNTTGIRYSGAVFTHLVGNTFTDNTTTSLAVTHGVHFNKGYAEGNRVLSGPALPIQGTSDAVGLVMGPGIPAVGSLPPATDALRGRMVRIDGAAGVADQLYVCRKNAADTYEWAALT